MRPDRVLILGASGMLGHRLMRTLAAFGYHVLGAARNGTTAWPDGIWPIEATRWGDAEAVLKHLRPDVVINCIGWVRQRSPGARYLEAVHVNAVFPHWLAEACCKAGIDLIHISTDCVHDGDWYGASKRLGEAIATGVVLRTSFIGHELHRKIGLLEWALAQRGRVDGYVRVAWNGLTSNELARVMAMHVLPKLEELKGHIWEICGSKITKHELLRLINQVYHCGLQIRPVDEPAADRCLDGRPFNDQVGYRPPSWEMMLSTMREEHQAAARASKVAA